MTKLEGEIADAARRIVAEGFDTESDIIESLCDIFADETPEEEIAPIVHREARAALEAHRQAQASWPVPTDNDRLDRAFAALRLARIEALQDFTCCQTCGFAEVGDELDDDSRGFTFFHEQDTEGAARGATLHLSFGAASGSDEEAIAIGQEVAAALAKEGLVVGWDGTLANRIGIALKWQKRRTF